MIYLIFLFKVKDNIICLLLIKTSKVIQDKMFILDDLFSGIEEFDKVSSLDKSIFI